MSRPPLRRIISLWLPRLPTDRLIRQSRHHLSLTQTYGLESEEPCLAVIEEDHRGASLYALTARAEAEGLHRGQRLTDARTLCPRLRTVPSARDQDALLLAGLRRWAGQWTPWTADDGPDGLLLDVTGCAHLFGGEASMLTRIAHAFRSRGFNCFLALAETRGAAWALARYEAPRRQAPILVPPGQTRTFLQALPPAALRLDADVSESLARLGLKSIADLLTLPRASLARRAGVHTVRRLDQAVGAEPEPISPAAPPPSYAVRQSLPEPLITLDAVLAVLERLLERLCAKLETRQEGLRGLLVSMRRVDHSESQTTIGLARPSRDLSLILRLSEHPLSAVKAGFGIEHMRIQALDVEPLTLYRQDSLAPATGQTPPPGALETLLSRLGGRLGFDQLLTLSLRDTHLPDQRNHWRPWGQHAPCRNTDLSQCPSGSSRVQPRPLLLFSPEPLHSVGPGRPPQTFSWRNDHFTTHHAEGPERIAPAWWDQDHRWQSGVRDYWRVQTDRGHRLWLFHLPQQAPQGSSPCWFVQGEFP